MSCNYFTESESGETIEHRLVHFELLHPENRPVAQLLIEGNDFPVLIMAYGHFESSEGEQTIQPLLVDPETGELNIICDCCHNLVHIVPPAYDRKMYERLGVKAMDETGQPKKPARAGKTGH